MTRELLLPCFDPWAVFDEEAAVPVTGDASVFPLGSACVENALLFTSDKVKRKELMNRRESTLISMKSPESVPGKERVEKCQEKTEDLCL